MKRIPLHSLVIMVGPANAGKSSVVSEKFQPYEVVSCESIRFEMTGDLQRHDINDIVFREVHRRTAMKIELGERVVVDAPNLRKKDRASIADIGIKAGVPVYYIIVNEDLSTKLERASSSWRQSPNGIITKQDNTFNVNERDILKGDGFANVIDTRYEDFSVVEKFSSDDMLDQIKNRGFRGLMVIGDVHGMIEPLKNAIEWATIRGLFCIFLGDIIDYGPHSLECVDQVYSIITRGRGISVMGNHERKIERWLDQVRHGDVRLRLSEGNKITTRAIESLSFDARRKFETRYNALLGFSRHHWVVGNTLFTHGAAEPEMFNIKTSRLTGKFETFALFGEVNNDLPSRNDGYPNRVYDWVDRIPEGKRVMVGHDIRNMFKPVVEKGILGGEAYFMDTGSGKGGRLTSADVIFEDDKMVIKAFKSH